MNNALVTNQAHENYTTFAFSPDGKWAYTGGADSLVRIWRTSAGADQEPQMASETEGPVITLTAWKDGWLSGSEDGAVRSYQAEGNALTGKVTQSTLDIRCIAVDPTGTKVAVASE